MQEVRITHATRKLRRVYPIIAKQCDYEERDCQYILYGFNNCSQPILQSLGRKKKKKDKKREGLLKLNLDATIDLQLIKRRHT